MHGFIDESISTEDEGVDFAIMTSQLHKSQNQYYFIK